MAKKWIKVDANDPRVMALVEKVAEEVGGRVYKDYGGRGMFGARCLGVDCKDKTACVEAAAGLGLRGAASDNLGKGWIIYWPAPEIKA